MRRIPRPQAIWRRGLREAEAIPGLRWLPTVVTNHRLEGEGRVTYSRKARAYRHTFGPVVIFDSRPRTATAAAYERMVTDVFAPHVTIRPGDTVIDVGAGVGSEAMVFARQVGPTGTVVAIEAHPETFRLLALNVPASVQAIQAAAGEEPGELVFTDFGVHEANYGIPADRAEGGQVVAVERLDDMPAIRACGRVRLLKMNIEGAETAALRGAPDLLARTDAVSISCHDFKADREGIEAMRTLAAVQELLTSSGFTVARAAKEGPAWHRDTLHGTR